jgi:hypothetical protein
MMMMIMMMMMMKYGVWVYSFYNVYVLCYKKAYKHVYISSQFSIEQALRSLGLDGAIMYHTHINTYVFDGI